MDQIVLEARLSKGAIYCYFKSKEELFLTLYVLQEEELRQRLANAFAEGGAVRQKLARGAQVFLSSLKAEYGEVARIGLEFWSEAPRRPDLQEQCRESYTRWQTFLARLLREGTRTGELRPDLNCEAIASAILGLCDGLCLQALTCGAVFEPEEVAGAFLSSLTHGIAPEPPRPRHSRRGR